MKLRKAIIRIWYISILIVGITPLLFFSLSNHQNTTIYRSRIIHNNIAYFESSILNLTQLNNNSGTYRSTEKSRICILSVDSRPVERFSTMKDLNNMSFHSMAVYNGLFYALRHGYDFRRIVAPAVPGYYVTWVKVAHMYATLHEYEIVVFLDPDAYVRNHTTTIEFLISRYNFTENSSILMAEEPNGHINLDSKGRRALNTGFIIARSNNLTKQILKDWAHCVDIIPHCNTWRYNFSYEQRAFSEYFRDKMKEGSELIIAPCSEVNGYDTSPSGCIGTLVSHVWSPKDTVTERLKPIMLDSLMTILESELWKGGHIHKVNTSDIRQMAFD